MGRLTDTVATVNSSVRTVLAIVLMAIFGGVGYVAYEKVTRDERELSVANARWQETEERLGRATQQIENLQSDLALAEEKVDQLETSLRLLKVDQRLAQLDILDKEQAEEGPVRTTVRFSELSPDGDPIGEPKEFTIDGDIIYLDNWVVKFEDRFVEEAHLQRGTSLALFRRLFGEFQNPADGYPLDAVGGMPQAYRSGGVPSDFEREIWSEFWTFANDREKAREKGIRAAHGEAISIRAEEGRSYRIVLRASDGLSIVPIDNGR